MKLLLECKADPNLIGEYINNFDFLKPIPYFAFPGGKYGTALQAACDRGQNGIMKLLLEHKADPNLIGK